MSSAFCALPPRNVGDRLEVRNHLKNLTLGLQIPKLRRYRKPPKNTPTTYLLSFGARTCKTPMDRLTAPRVHMFWTSVAAAVVERPRLSEATQTLKEEVEHAFDG